MVLSYRNIVLFVRMHLLIVREIYERLHYLPLTGNSVPELQSKIVAKGVLGEEMWVLGANLILALPGIFWSSLGVPTNFDNRDTVLF